MNVSTKVSFLSRTGRILGHKDHISSLCSRPGSQLNLQLYREISLKSPLIRIIKGQPGNILTSGWLLFRERILFSFRAEPLMFFIITIKKMILLHILTFLAKKRNFWLIFKGIGAEVQSKKEGMFFIMSIHIIVLNLLNEKKRLKSNYFRPSHWPFECPGKWRCNSTEIAV